jgi:hypothetical protein
MGDWGGLRCMEFNVLVCMCIPSLENVSGLFAPAGLRNSENSELYHEG